MRIKVFDRGGKVSEPVGNYVRLRLMSELDQLVRQVNEVLVSLADDDARDGAGKRCAMLALLDPSGAVPVEKADSDLYAAIDRAAEELAQVVALELARRETTTRSLGKLREDTAVATLGPKAPGMRRERWKAPEPLDGARGENPSAR